MSTLLQCESRPRWPPRVRRTCASEPCSALDGKGVHRCQRAPVPKALCFMLAPGNFHMVASQHHIPGPWIGPWTLNPGHQNPAVPMTGKVCMAACEDSSAHSNARLPACAWCRARGSSKPPRRQTCSFSSTAMPRPPSIDPHQSQQTSLWPEARSQTRCRFQI